MKTLLLLLAGALPVLAQAPSISSVVNSASQDNRLSPGCVAVINGDNLGYGEGLVLVGVTYAAVLVGTPTQMTIQIPFEVQPGPWDVVVQMGTMDSKPFKINLTPLAPGLESMDYTGKGMGTFTLPNGAFVTAATPATPTQIITLWATGLGPTNPQVPSGVANTAAPTAMTPTVMVGGEQAQVTSSLFSADVFGYYKVSFAVPADLPIGNATVVLKMGDQTSNMVLMPIGKPTPLLLSVVSGVSIYPSPQVASGAVAPGELVIINGGNMGDKDNVKLFPNTSAEGVSVTMNGIPMPMFYLLPSVSRVYAFIPTEIPVTGNGTITVTNASGTASIAVRQAAALPGLFRIQDPSRPTRLNAAALFGNTVWRAVPTSMATALGWPTNCKTSGIDPLTLCGQPAAVGDTIQLYGTGLGKATPNGDPSGTPLPTGQAAPADNNPIYWTLLKPVVTVGGVAAPVQFSGVLPGYAGIYQINFQIPKGAPTGDDVAVVVNIPGQGSDAATISIH